MPPACALQRAVAVASCWAVVSSLSSARHRVVSTPSTQQGSSEDPAAAAAEGRAGTGSEQAGQHGVFRDFGTIRMYEAGDLYDPLVLPCSSAGDPCCGDGVCQQHCTLDLEQSDLQTACVGGHESPHNCPEDCEAGVTSATRRSFELFTGTQPQASSLFPVRTSIP